MYDIRKSSESYGEKPVWGREFYAQDGAGMYVPVLFVPYFERRMADKWVPAWSLDQEGNRIRNGDRYITKGEVFIIGIKQIWDDRNHILAILASTRTGWRLRMVRKIRISPKGPTT